LDIVVRVSDSFAIDASFWSCLFHDSRPFLSISRHAFGGDVLPDPPQRLQIAAGQWTGWTQTTDSGNIKQL